MTAFHKTKVANVVNRGIGASNGDRWRAGLGQVQTLGKQWIEHDAGTALGFTPHAKETRQLFAEFICSWLVCLDCQANGSCRARVGRTQHAAAELFAQDTSHQWQLTAAAGDVQSSKFAVMLSQ